MEKRALVHAGCFRVGCYDGLDLIRQQGRNVHILRFEILRHHGGDVIRGERCGQRTARDLLIGHDKGSDRCRRQPGGVHAFLFQVLHDVGRDLVGRKR